MKQKADQKKIERPQSSPYESAPDHRVSRSWEEESCSPHLRSYRDDESDVRYDWERGRYGRRSEQTLEFWYDSEARWENEGGLGRC
jgi:hypothetical protein